MEYEILPHTADLRIRARGKTLEELFRNALRGMSSVMQPQAFDRQADVEREIALKSPDQPSLLVDFLAEALTLVQINREVYSDVIFGELSQTSLRATLSGVRVSEFAEDIKAVTYHGVEIKETDAGYEATVVYDI
ncbi:MAG: archease [Patescibacteria group bacterium]